MVGMAANGLPQANDILVAHLLQLPANDYLKLMTFLVYSPSSPAACTCTRLILVVWLCRHFLHFLLLKKWRDFSQTSVQS